MTTDTAPLIRALEALVEAMRSGDNNRIADASWEADGACLATPFDDADADPRFARIKALVERANDENGKVAQAERALKIARTI